MSLRSFNRLPPVVRRIGVGCELRVLGCDRPKNRRGGGGLRKFGLKIALGRKRKGERKFLFIFRKHFREKQNNLEIAR
jgi:hypothetical protein